MSDLDKAYPGQPTDEQIAASKKMWRKDQRRMMDYFWSKRSGSHREHVPASVIYWLEGERGNLDRGRIDFELSGLETDNNYTGSNYLGDKKYLARKTLNGENGYELTGDGKVYIWQRHPPIFQLWEKALELSPPTLSLLAALVGFVASVFGIIQFVDWLRHLPP
jgi:hypothetical protein